MIYTTEAEVRAFTRTRKTQYPLGDTGAISGSVLTLKEAALAINSIKKNGALLVVTTDYTFTEPQTVTFVVAPVSTDTFIVEYDTGLKSADITTLIRRASAWVNSKLNGWYTVPFAVDGNSEYPPDIVQIATWWAAYLALQRLYTGEQEALSKAGGEYFVAAMSMVKEIYNASRPLVNSDGTIVARLNKAVGSALRDEGMFFGPPDQDDEDWGTEFTDSGDLNL